MENIKKAIGDDSDSIVVKKLEGALSDEPDDTYSPWSGPHW